MVKGRKYYQSTLLSRDVTIQVKTAKNKISDNCIIIIDEFFRSAWNKFDFIITILAVFVYTWDEVQKRVKFPADVVDGAELVEKIINVLRPLRLLRYLRTFLR